MALLATAGYEVESTSSGLDVLEWARERRPSIVILEVALEGVSGYEVCRALREEHGESIPIVFVSGVRKQSYDRVAGLLVGANDYVVRPFAADELLTRVRNLSRSEPPQGQSLAARLTKREIEILRLLANGREPREIAEKLVISQKTVSSHVENILRKFGVHNRTQAVVLAYRHDLIELEEPSNASPGG